MKLAKITVICIIILALVNFVTKDFCFSLKTIPKLLPFCSGKPVNHLYELSAVILILILIRGLCRLSKKNEETEENVEPDSGQEDYSYDTQYQNDIDDDS